MHPHRAVAGAGIIAVYRGIYYLLDGLETNLKFVYQICMHPNASRVPAERDWHELSAATE